MDVLKHLHLERKIEVVDVGAADLQDGTVPPYKPLVEAGAARVTGFEPNEQEFAKLPQTETQRYLNQAVGDGRDYDYFVTRHPGFCSLLKPNMAVASKIRGLATHMEVVDTLNISTQRLDDIQDILKIDFLKIDIQGGEDIVFAGAAQKLSKTLMVQTEVAFWPLYENQPSFAEQHATLSRLGFQFFGMQSVNRFRLTGTPRRHLKQSRRRG